MNERLCFVIAPIGDTESETRKRSDQVLKHVIAPAVGTAGYQAVRADQISEPGLITSQVIQHIVDDPLVVADLTDRNPNVFYELAIRHAIRKPLIQLIRAGEQIPFDVAGTRTIHLDHRDLDSVEEAKGQIQAQIAALEKGNLKVETPISVALDLQILRESGNPEARSLADVLAAVTEIRTNLAKVAESIRHQDPIQLLLLQKIMGERQSENNAMKARLYGASREVREAVRNLSLLEGARDKDVDRALKDVCARLETVIAVLPEASGE